MTPLIKAGAIIALFAVGTWVLGSIVHDLYAIWMSRREKPEPMLHLCPDCDSIYKCPADVCSWRFYVAPHRTAGMECAVVMKGDAQR